MSPRRKWSASVSFLLIIDDTDTIVDLAWYPNAGYAVKDIACNNPYPGKKLYLCSSIKEYFNIKGALGGSVIGKKLYVDDFVESEDFEFLKNKHAIMMGALSREQVSFQKNKMLWQTLHIQYCGTDPMKAETPQEFRSTFVCNLRQIENQGRECTSASTGSILWGLQDSRGGSKWSGYF